MIFELNTKKTFCVKFSMIKKNFYLGGIQFFKNHPMQTVLDEKHLTLKFIAELFLHAVFCHTSTLCIFKDHLEKVLWWHFLIFRKKNVFSFFFFNKNLGLGCDHQSYV